MKMRCFRILLSAAVVMLLSCGVSYASPRARSRAETILNDESKRISVGFDHTCQVKEDGTVRCWGGNSFGQLGNNSTTASSTPLLVSGISSAVAVAAGRFFTCAVLSDGTARCWGVNNLGQLGKGNITTKQLTPVTVVGVEGIGILSNVVAITAGEAHTCALLANGRASCWGVNQTGQLGEGSFFFGGGGRPTPGTVINLSNAVAITAGFFHTCALIADGTAKCWGTNVKGELGIGTFQDNPFGFETAPVPVRDVSRAVAIAAGGAHTCAVLADSTAKCWGLDNHGQLGDRVRTDDLTDYEFIPVAVIGSVEGGIQKVLNNVVAITAGNAHTCALLADGTAKCWGLNADGQLGIGNTQPDLIPPTTVAGTSGDPLRNVVAISTGGHRCFVDNGSIGDIGDFQCAGSGDHTCALLADGSAKCWGNNQSGQLGNSVSPKSFEPVPVAGGGGSFTARDIAAGRNHTCAVRANGTVACWGSNSSGQIGDGTIGGNRPSPFTIPNLNNVVAVAAGEAHTCALRADGTVRCWGANGNGQLGPGFVSSSSPTPITPFDITNAVAIAAGGALGNSHTCALIADGTVKCWGANGSGQLGTGNTIQSSIPITVGGLGNAVSIAVGETHTCALVAVGFPFCWGFDGSGQLGNDAALSSQSLPRLVSLGNTVAIAGGNLNTCALRADGSTWCWGSNLLGQVGINSTLSPQPLPRLVVDPTNAVVTSAVSVAGGFGHTCAAVANGTVRCWGDNASGQLGNATTSISPSTTPVVVGSRLQGLFGVTLFRPLGGVVNITTGRRHSCALSVNGAVFCWGENIFRQLGNNSTASFSSTPVAVPSFTLNIDPTVALRPNGRVTTVTVIATCEEGQRLFFDVDLTQGAASGRGFGTGECTGALERYEVTVPALGRDAFLDGPAEVSAKAVIRDGGLVVDVQEWTRQVDIINAPAHFVR
jgi:alpha-tubulin suppressor-like RCC1 family protein